MSTLKLALALIAFVTAFYSTAIAEQVPVKSGGAYCEAAEKLKAGFIISPAVTQAPQPGSVAKSANQ